MYRHHIKRFKIFIESRVNYRYIMKYAFKNTQSLLKLNKYLQTESIIYKHVSSDDINTPDTF